MLEYKRDTLHILSGRVRSSESQTKDFGDRQSEGERANSALPLPCPLLPSFRKMCTKSTLLKQKGYRLPRSQWHRLQWHPCYSDTFDSSQMASHESELMSLQWHLLTMTLLLYPEGCPCMLEVCTGKTRYTVLLLNHPVVTYKWLPNEEFCGLLKWRIMQPTTHFMPSPPTLVPNRTEMLF